MREAVSILLSRPDDGFRSFDNAITLKSAARHSRASLSGLSADETVVNLKYSE
jgi:hypothetical protein